MRNLSDVILKPVITEKAMDMISGKRYVFKVQATATKPEIAAAIEEMFGVEVADVNTINMAKKPKRLGVHAGYKGEWKKAIVSLKPSSKSIEFFDSMN